MKNKIKTYSEIKEIASRWREDGRTLVTTNGSFDIFAFSPYKFIRESKK